MSQIFNIVLGCIFLIMIAWNFLYVIYNLIISALLVIDINAEYITSDNYFKVLGVFFFILLAVAVLFLGVAIIEFLIMNNKPIWKIKN